MRQFFIDLLNLLNFAKKLYRSHQIMHLYIFA